MATSRCYTILADDERAESGIPEFAATSPDISSTVSYQSCPLTSCQILCRIQSPTLSTLPEQSAHVLHVGWSSQTRPLPREGLEWFMVFRPVILSTFPQPAC